MKHRLAFAAVSGVAAALIGVAALTSPTVPAGAQAAPPTDPAHTKALYQEKCSACHNLPNPEEKGYNRQQWQRTVRLMITKYKADDITPAQAAQIVDYLATFAPKRGRDGRPTDPWATDAEDVWAMAPAATRVFNFEAAGQMASLLPITAGTSGPAAVWHTVATPGQANGTVVKVAPIKPTASRFALLVDRGDTARNLDAKVRFQIQGGTVSPAVGIAFGFQNPKTYSVLRYDAAKNELTLLQVNEPTHTTLQRTPLNPPAPNPGGAGPAPVVLSLAPPKLGAGGASSGWHTLRLLVRDGQVRGWLDMTKRVSVQVAGYTGGKVGLWTQGDTVAAFDDWTLDLYDGAQTVPTGADE